MKILRNVHRRKPRIISELLKNSVIMSIVLDNRSWRQRNALLMKFFSKKVIFWVELVRAKERIGIPNKSFPQLPFYFNNDWLHIINGFCPDKNAVAVGIVHPKNKTRIDFFVEELNKILLFLRIKFFEIKHQPGRMIS